MKILIIMALILLFPIPIKFRISYIDKVLKIKLFNINLKRKPKKHKDTKKEISKEDIKSEDYTDYKNAIKKNKSVYISTLKILIKKLRHNVFKPTLRLNFRLEYDLDNAATTALMYPLITEFLTLVCTMLRIPFTVKKNNISVICKFENSFFANCDLSCIFILNLAKLINMIILLLLSYLGGKKYGKSSNRKFNEVNYGKS